MKTPITPAEDPQALPSNFFSSSNKRPIALPDSLLRNCPIPLRLNNRIICNPIIEDEEKKQDQQQNNNNNSNLEQLELVDEVTEEEKMEEVNEGTEREERTMNDNSNDSEMTLLSEFDAAESEGTVRHREEEGRNTETGEEEKASDERRQQKDKVPRGREEETPTVVGDVPESPNIGTANEIQTKHPKTIPLDNIEGRQKPSDPRKSKRMGENSKQQQMDEGTALTDWEINDETGERPKAEILLMILPKFAIEYRHKTTKDSGTKGEEHKKQGKRIEEKGTTKDGGQSQQQKKQQQGEGMGTFFQ